MAGFLPLLIMILGILAVLFIVRKIGRVKFKTHRIILGIYLSILLIASAYYLIMINPNFEAIPETVAHTGIMAEYDDEENLLYQDISSDYIHESGSVTLTNNRFVLDSPHSRGYPLTIVIEEVASLQGEATYTWYEAPVMLEHNNKHYDITERARRMGVSTEKNKLIIEDVKGNSLVKFNGLDSSSLLTQFKRDDANWWVSEMENGYSYGHENNVMVIHVPSGTELDIGESLERLVIRK